MNFKIYTAVTILSLAFSIQGLQAQDTIDTAYYRYSIRPQPYFGHPYAFYDTLTGQYPIDPVSGEYISVCPNGNGFFYFFTLYNTTYTIGGNFFYAHYDLGTPESDLYGIALQLRDVEDFTEGDSMVATLYEWPDYTNPPIPIDSIVINGGNVGKRRWMEIPLLQSGATYTSGNSYGQLTQSFCSTIHDNCIGSIAYLPIMEFYFDTVRHISSDSLWYMLKIYREHRSNFVIAGAQKPTSYSFVFRDITTWRITDNWSGDWHRCFPITAPLPDWEVSSLDTLIPMPTKPDNPDPGDPQNPDDPNDPDNPDDPNDPDNPDNPDNPQDPEDPEDPENPGGDEGIDNFEIQNSNFEINIYPNPASGVTTVSSEEPIIDMVVRDMAGRTVMHQTACGTTASFDTTTLRKGVYLVKVTTTRGTATKKLVVE